MHPHFIKPKSHFAGGESLSGVPHLFMLKHSTCVKCVLTCSYTCVKCVHVDVYHLCQVCGDTYTVYTV